ncbi:MAG TPA: hypothetical protein VEH76_14680 [Methylocystis sp.]|nr:hypothetical protein [Methylocystis sp.]
MKSGTFLGLLIGASLLIGYEPVAEAMPAAAPGNATEISSADGLVVKTLTRAGIHHRTVRRTSRRVARRHRL